MKKVEFDNALNEAGWVMLNELQKFGHVGGHVFNNMKPCLKVAIEKYLSESDKEKPIPQTKEVEWDGEYQLEGGSGWFKYKSTYIASSGDMFAMCLVPNANKGQPFEQYLDVETTKFRKLETPEQKLEREELEAAYDLYCDAVDRETLFDSFCNFGPLKDIYLRIVRKTNYKVKGE